MKFEEKKKMKKEEIRDLFCGFGRLMGEGEFEFRGSKLKFPETAEVEVEYKEKKGRAKLEVEIKWRIDTTGGEEEVEEREKVSLGGVKKSLKKSFNNLRSTVQTGRTPSERELQEFLELNHAFADRAKNVSYDQDLALYMSIVKGFEEAVKKGDMEEMKALITDLRASKKKCHKTYRWKEEG